MRTLLVALTIAVNTIVLGLTVIVAGLLRIPSRRGGIYEWCARTWASSLCRAAGVEIVMHGTEHLSPDEARVYVANHVSWFDIFALATVLPYYTFIAKAELRKIPLFGRACEAFGIVFIERTNRKSAFESYRDAAAQVTGGRSVVVCPEGTRGYSYSLRPFKKGPFVFAISAGVPVVPCVVYGTIRVQPKGSFRIRPGRVDLHFLEPVPTAGLGYEERDRVMRTVWDRMATALHDLYGVESRGSAIEKEAGAVRE